MYIAGIYIAWLAALNVEALFSSYINIAFGLNQTDLAYFGIAAIIGSIISTIFIQPIFKKYPNYKAFIIIGVGSLGILKGMSVYLLTLQRTY